MLCATASAGVLHDIANDIAAKLAAVRAARAPKPPVPVAVKWHPVKLSPSFELGAPVIALAAADLDGDGKPELYAVTTREVIAFALADHHVKELARVPFTGDAAIPAPRDPVGAAVVEGRTLVASSSSFAHELRVGWRGKQLSGDAGDTGIELCAGEHVPLAAGRDFFGDKSGERPTRSAAEGGAKVDDKAGYYGVRCKDLADPAGHVLRVRATLGLTGKLDVAVARCEGDACQRASDVTIGKAGTAFELADLDRDGRPEVIFASANAPGEPDEVWVVTLGEDDKKPKLKKTFTAGGVAALAVGDFDGAPAIIAAVRLVGSTRVDLWRLN
ncbi:MAG TPA: hypothetical protein VFQ65_17865 [Kofleriaceae bacterium]|nr:hypothetical protein [Kofleriaceae bacterium]